MSSHEKIAIVWNPSAGSADGAAEVLARLRKDARCFFLQTTDREETIHQVAGLVDEGVSLVVAAGGDGTISSVVQGIMQSPFPLCLGVLPLGTGNDFARSLQIPLDANEAIAVWSTGNIRHLDMVRYTTAKGGGWFANMMTGGNTGRYLEKITDEVKQRWGPFCYLRGVIDVIQDLQTYELTVSCDDNPAVSCAALNVFLANGMMSGGGMAVSPLAELDDGLVDLVIVRDGDVGQITGLTAEYLTADFLEHELIEFQRSRRIQIESTPPLQLTADGDLVGKTPLTIKVRPRCLRVIAPPPQASMS